MEAIIYLWGFKFCFPTIRNRSEYKWILIDEVGHNSQIPEGCFEEIYYVDYNSFSEADQIIQDLQKRYKIKAIIASMEKAIELGGWLRSKYEIPGLKYEESICFRNKYEMKLQVQKSNVNTAKCKVVNSLNDLLNFVNEQGYPIIVKPLAGFATANTFKIRNHTDLDKYIDNNDFNESILAEEFITGEEYHCDSLVVGGEVIFSSVGKYLFPILTVVEEDKPDGSIIYPNVNQPYILAIKQCNAQSVKALNVKNGVTHAEYFTKPDGSVYFGELAVRIGGGSIIADCIQNTHGVNFFEEFINVEIGEPVNIDKYKEVAKGIYTANICFPSKEGTIRYISDMNDLNSVSGIIKVKFRNKIGDKISYKSNSAIRTGYAIMECDTYEGLEQNIRELLDTFKLEVVE